MAETFNTVTIKDREVAVRTLNETQMMLLVREARVLGSRRADPQRTLRGIAMMIDIVESAIVDPEDQEWLMGLAGTGQIEFGEILKLVSDFEESAVIEAKPVRRAAKSRR